MDQAINFIDNCNTIKTLEKILKVVTNKIAKEKAMTLANQIKSKKTKGKVKEYVNLVDCVYIDEHDAFLEHQYCKVKNITFNIKNNCINFNCKYFIEEGVNHYMLCVNDKILSYDDKLIKFDSEQIEPLLENIPDSDIDSFRDTIQFILKYCIDKYIV